MLETAAQSSADEQLVTLLAQMGAVLASAEKLEEFFSASARMIEELLGVEGCSIFLLDRRDNKLKVKAATRIPRSEWPGIQIPLGEGIVGKVAQTGKGILAADAARFRPASPEAAQRYKTASFISVPIELQARAIGVINVDSKRDASAFSRREAQLLRGIAGVFASALSTSQLLEERAAASRFLDCILGSIPMGIVTLDEQLCVTHCNRAARELLGIGEHHSALATLETLFPCDVSPCVKELIQELKCTGVSACVEIERRPSPTRDPIPLGLSVWALLQGRGIPTDILIVIEDLSLRREISELRHLSEVKSHFISLISHELRTPLTSMKGSLHLLRHVKGFELPEKQSRLLEIVDRNTQRLAGLVENLLEVQNLESGETRIDLKPEPLEEIVLECLEERSAAWENKQIHCRFLADGAAKSELPLDRERIKHVFKHIIDNAFKYSNPEGEVTVEIAECQGWAEIRVTNTGPPIPAKYRGKIFDKFWQVESTMTRETGGSGLGLYLAKRVVALHRGEIGLERSDESGTTFLVRLPMLSAASWLPGL